MKKTRFVFMVTVLALGLLFASCESSGDQTKSTESKTMEANKEKAHDNGDDKHDRAADREIKSLDFSSQKNDKTAALISGYESIKKGLEIKESASAAEGAKTLLAAFEKFEAPKLKKSQEKEYGEIVESAKEHAEHIVKSQIDHQKEHFEGLTKDFKDLFAIIGAKKED